MMIQMMEIKSYAAREGKLLHLVAAKKEAINLEVVLEAQKEGIALQVEVESEAVGVVGVVDVEVDEVGAVERSSIMLRYIFIFNVQCILLFTPRSMTTDRSSISPQKFYSAIRFYAHYF
jgi:hypothetical protein